MFIVSVATAAPNGRNCAENAIESSSMDDTTATASNSFGEMLPVFLGLAEESLSL
jgi:hypothetical protein